MYVFFMFLSAADPLPGVFHIITVTKVQLCTGSCGEREAQEAGNF